VVECGSSQPTLIGIVKISDRTAPSPLLRLRLRLTALLPAQSAGPVHVRNRAYAEVPLLFDGRDMDNASSQVRDIRERGIERHSRAARRRELRWTSGVERAVAWHGQAGPKPLVL